MERIENKRRKGRQEARHNFESVLCLDADRL